LIPSYEPETECFQPVTANININETVLETLRQFANSKCAASGRGTSSFVYDVCQSTLLKLSHLFSPRGPCGLEAKSFGLGRTLSGLGLDLGLMASGLGLIQIGLVNSHLSKKAAT